MFLDHFQSVLAEYINTVWISEQYERFMLSSSSFISGYGKDLGMGSL